MKKHAILYILLIFFEVLWNDCTHVVLNIWDHIND